MTTRPNRLLIAVCVACFACPVAAFPNAREPEPARAAEAGKTAPGVTADAVELPMCFEQNVGQTDGEVTFLTRASGMNAFLTAGELVLSLPRSTPFERTEPEPIEKRAEPIAPAVVRMRLSGAGRSTPVGEQQLVTRTSYFLGDDPERWRTDIPNFARVRYPEVYPGVDLVYYGTRGRLEYDFVVAPGADPNAISLEWDGAESIEVGPDGSLVMRAGDGELRQLPPVLYQQDDGGERRAVAGAFAPLGDGRVALRAGAYDRGRPLVVDPVIDYSTYLGSSGGDTAQEVAVDSDGAVYVTGWTTSIDFPTPTGYDRSFNLSYDTFVTKMNAAGSDLVYSTYLGGSGDDGGVDIAVGTDGSAYVTGTTSSRYFPRYRAIDSTLDGGNDAFVVKLTPSGTALGYSTFLGGDGVDSATGIAVDGAGAAYVTGGTESGDFPTTSNAYDATFGGVADAFVSKLKLGSYLVPTNIVLRLEYSTYLGGQLRDRANDVAVDSSGAAHVTGETYSDDFPTKYAFDATYNGVSRHASPLDAFVTKLNPAGSGLAYSTYLGGAGADSGSNIALGSDGAAHVTGSTSSFHFPTTPNAFQPAQLPSLDPSGSVLDVFVTKLVLGTYIVPTNFVLRLEYSTYISGGDMDEVEGIAVGSDGSAYVTGRTWSTDFPVTDGTAPTSHDRADIFVTKLDPTGGSPSYSTCLGDENGAERGGGIDVDASGAAYVVGTSYSSGFDTENAYDPDYNGGDGDVFVVKLREPSS